MPHPSAPAASPNRLVALLGRVGIDWFLLGLILAVTLAYLRPGIGSDASPVPWDRLLTFGVALVFFFYGLRLSPESLRTGMRNWRLHLVVQASTFLLFPLIGLALRPLFGPDAQGATLWSSVFYLCTVPSTVSTSVVMVSVAGGNLPAAIFNASISSLIGLVMTPLWVSLVLHTGAAGGGHLGPMVLDLVLQVVVPVGLGLLLHRRFGAWAEAHKGQLRKFDQCIILVLVYTSFCESFARNVFRDYSWGDLLGLAAGMVALFLAVLGLITLVSRLLGFAPEDQITAVFCGSKKSLVHGSVLAKILFAGTVASGALLLPLMLYHALQIILASIIAQRVGQRMTARPVVAAG
ncbi:bile acid:sodium symporter [Hymenobacter sp. 15J16-1T3B]|uniref:bile acid:sodium symporter family protein n=1 Tax=Hymenobacter sp. 15J16-1T3B TaxID=2886941 RepID=UPI001D12E345|nr:bile acid:sodium symporter family protein [Hymenobacter sp. 15J16-1T3B]MCC3160109.1 bile acid:sodium symporter [Hymenobacter sp. 15J16-1T3B]